MHAFGSGFRLVVFALSSCCAHLSLLPVHAAESAGPQARNILAVPATSGLATAPRVALIIGNAAYKNGPLANPVNDARDMAGVLSGLGFSVTLKENTSLRELKQSVRGFAAQIKQGAVGLFYFAGHGVQSKGKNYLIPVDAEISQEYELEDQAQDANLVLAAMDEAQNAVNILILDACRNNPYTRSFRSVSNGLAQMDAPKGTLIAYATAPGSVAADGNERNGIYTKHLLHQLQQGDSDISKVFSRVRAAVVQETGSRQIPWESTSLVGDFYFKPGQAGGPASVQPSSAPAPVSPLAVEIAYWQSAEKSNTELALQSYLNKYPAGQFVDLAKSKISALSQSGAPSLPTPSKAPAATVTFFRPGGFVGSGVDYEIMLDGREVGVLKSGSSFTLQVPSGLRTVSAEGASVGIQRAYEFAPGGSYFIQLDYAFLSGLTLKLSNENAAKGVSQSGEK